MQTDSFHLPEINEKSSPVCKVSLYGYILWFLLYYIYFDFINPLNSNPNRTRLRSTSQLLYSLHSLSTVCCTHYFYESVFSIAGLFSVCVFVLKWYNLIYFFVLFCFFHLFCILFVKTPFGLLNHWTLYMENKGTCNSYFPRWENKKS